MNNQTAFVSAGLMALLLLVSSCSKSTEPEPQVGKIVFASQTDNPYADIYSINDNGTNLQRITETETICDYPSCSPDGEKIVYCQFIYPENHIFVMNIDGSNDRQLTFSDSSESDSTFSYATPRWSPDGSEIVCSRSSSPGCEGCPDIFIMNADGSNLHKVYGEDDVSESNPSWSPDGSKILFESYLNGGGLYSITPDGTGLTVIIEGQGVYKEPYWSPDGSQIAYSYKPHSEQELIYQIYIVNADGSNPVNISNNFLYERQPVWNAEGNKLIFVTTEVDQFNKEIFIMNTDGSERINLTNTSGADTSPSLLY